MTATKRSNKQHRVTTPSPSRPCRCQPGLATIITSLLFLGNNCIDGFAPSTTVIMPRALFGNHAMCNSAASTKLFGGNGIDPDHDLKEEEEASRMAPSKNSTPPSAMFATLTGGGPPLDVDDTQLLLYDVFLLVNLSVSISFLVIHRMNFSYLPSSLNEGALLSICWIVAGLANGAFLSSAVDGHYDPMGADYEKGGPRAAGLLAISTFVGTSSLRIMIALGMAVVQHRPVGIGGEELIPLQILFGLVLMSGWRSVHSVNTPRI